MKDPLMNILISLYGEEFREDFEEHLALLKEINNYHTRKRIDIEQQSKFEFLYLADTLRHKYQDIYCYFNDEDAYWPYSEWFKEVFIKDYDKALIEVERQYIPSNRKLCIFRLAREANYKNITLETIYKFCREYLINTEEYAIFWNEYYNTKIILNNNNLNYDLFL